LADTHEERRPLTAHNPIDRSSDLPTRVGGRHRHCHDDSSRTLAAKGLHRGPHARPCRKAVVHDDCRLAGQVQGRPAFPVGAFAALELLQFRCAHVFDIESSNSDLSDDFFVEDGDATARDGSHRQLLVSGNAELANDEHVERRAQDFGDLGCDDHATARQPQHDDVRPIGILRQLRRQHTPGSPSVREEHRQFPPVSI